VASRDARNLLMIDLLRKEGFDITADALRNRFGNSVITRAHFANYLVETGMVKDRKEVFDKYLGDGCRCYIEREKMPTCDAIRLIKQAGGIAVLAHPVLYHYNQERFQTILQELKKAGLDAIEAIYTTNAPGDERNFKRIAKENDLLISGGSDFHGSNKPHISLGTGLGSLYVPYEVLENLKKLPHVTPEF
jgi:hypothetical protein